MKELLAEMEARIKDEIEQLTSPQKNTLKALLFSGYKGEREQVLLELLKTMGEEKISPSPLTESFTSSFEDEANVKYWRIKPEFYRMVRKKIMR